jgi:hypothetical protein
LPLERQEKLRGIFKLNTSKIKNKILERTKLKTEEYISSVVPSYVRAKTDPDSFLPIFKNPDKSEIRELADFGNKVRFIAYKNNLYVFPAELLHLSAVKELAKIPEIGIPISAGSDSHPKVAFLGIAKINLGTYKLKFTETNQKLDSNALDYIEKNYGYIERFFE